MMKMDNHSSCEYLLHFGIVISFSVLFLSHDGTDSPPDASDVVVILNNFKSKIIKVKVSLPALAATVREQTAVPPVARPQRLWSATV